jgi:dTDP-4-dehydrorhamnose 3,5-epimerase
VRFRELSIRGAHVVEPEPIRDARGFLARVFADDEFARAGFPGQVVQMNHTSTLVSGTVRGLHYQLPPHAEYKVIKCIRGRVYDVVVDLRAGSATFLAWAAVELSEDNMHMMFIPAGCAHGFQALAERCELIYLHSAPYVKESERGARADDPAIGIRWPLPLGPRSPRDESHPLIDTNTFKGVAL